MPDLRIAVVGAGILGRRYARVLTELDGVLLAGVTSRTFEKAREVAATWGAPAYRSLHDLLHEAPCDAVVVATPDHLHADPVLGALRHGRHVLVEKPLATTLEDARLMVQRAHETGRLLQVNYSQRWVPEYAWIKEKIAAGTIGRPVLATSSKQDTAYVPTRMISWAADTSPVFFMSSHDLDLVAWFFAARATAVVAHEHRGVLVARGLPVHDGVDALVRYDTGARASFHSSWIHPETWPTIVTERMTIIGERGVIHYEGRERRVSCFNEEGGESLTFTGPQTATEVAGRLEGGFRQSLEEFCRCIRAGEEPATSAAHTLHITRTQLAILASAAAGGVPASVS